MALVHYPVINKRGDVIASAVTNLDIHDIARAVRTYNARKFYIITPLEDQTELVKTLISHWTEGAGAAYNPKRREALETVVIRQSLETVYQDIATRHQGVYPQTIVTSARNNPDVISTRSLREMLESGTPYLLVFGTAWGLSQDCMDAADHILAPIQGDTAYNHLSVRSAASIILDRLLGDRS